MCYNTTLKQIILFSLFIINYKLVFNGKSYLLQKLIHDQISANLILKF